MTIDMSAHTNTCDLVFLMCTCVYMCVHVCTCVYV